jgi:hypothetical protein
MSVRVSPERLIVRKKIVKEKDVSLEDMTPRNLLSLLLHAWLESKSLSFHHYVHKKHIGIVTATST